MVAARALAGDVSQAELGKLWKEDGVPQEDVGKIERGEKRLRAAHIDSMVRHLHVPREWFTVDDFHAWLAQLHGEAPPGLVQEIQSVIAAQRETLLAELREVESHRARAAELLPQTDPEGAAGPPRK